MMAYKKLRLSLAVVVAMTVLAGCSSNKNADSGDTGAGNTGYNTGTSTGTYGDGSGNANGSDYAQNGRTVYFDFDRFTLSPEGQATVDRNLSAIKSGSQVRLEGHADERGTREYNLALGERRANAVAQYLEANGVSKSRIEIISYGKERPADPGHDESAWAKNRRVEIILN
jgi:peptidoglycan-associated lipoprotein